MSYILAFVAGVLVGFLITAIITSSGYTNKIQEAYDDGYKMGLNNNKNQV